MGELLVKRFLLIPFWLTVAFAFGQSAVIYEPSIPDSVLNDLEHPYQLCQDTVRLIGNKPTSSSTTRIWTVSSPLVKFKDGVANKDTVFIIISTGEPFDVSWRIGNKSSIISLQSLHPTRPVLGSDTIVCQGKVRLKANRPVIGTGQWESLTVGATFTNINSDTTTVALTNGINTLVWKISSTCDTLRDTIVVDNQAPSLAFVGTDRIVCSDTVHLKATPLSQNESGLWSANRAGVFISPDISEEAIASNLQLGENIFTWKVKKGTCEGVAGLTITYNKPNTASILTMNDTVVCSNEVELNAVKVKGGKWMQGIGTGVIVNDTLAKVKVTNLSNGTNTFEWAVQNANCGSSSATVTVFNKSVTKPTTQTDSCILGPFGSTLTVSVKNAGSLKPDETGIWSVVSAPASLSITNNAIDRSASFTPQGAGLYRFLFTVNNNNCSNQNFSNYYLIRRARLPNDTCLLTATAGQPVSFSLTARSSPIGTEKGVWILPNNQTRNGTSISYSAPSGVYRFIYSIIDTTCSNCSKCHMANQDTMFVTVLTKAAITNYISCTVDSSQALKASAVVNGESTNWSSNNSFTTFSPNGSSAVTAQNIKVGKTVVTWMVTRGTCQSSDQVTITRLTKPNGGADRCYGFEPTTPPNTRIDTIVGNIPNASVGETAKWDISGALAVNFDNINSTSLILKPSPRGVFYLKRNISNGTCSSDDSVAISFVTKPQGIDTSFLYPDTAKVMLTGTSPSVVDKEYAFWIGVVNDTTRGNRLTKLPSSLPRGISYYQYVIGKSQSKCQQVAKVNITLITKPQIKGGGCLGTQTTTAQLEGNKDLMGFETGFWTLSDSTVYKKDSVTVYFAPPNVLQLTGLKTNKYTAIWKIKSGRFTVSEQVEITKLTPLAVKNSYCVMDSLISLQPTLPLKLQPYEVIRWIKKDNNSSFLKNKKGSIDTLQHLTPGIHLVALVVADTKSTCTDTSNISKITMISRPQAGLDKCLLDTLYSLSTKKDTIESVRWKDLGSGKLSVFDNANSAVTMVRGLRKRENILELKLFNKADTFCLATDTVKLVVTSKAVAPGDTCIKGAKTISLVGHGNKEPHESWYWALLTKPDSAISGNSNLASYSNLKQGKNTFLWTISYKSVGQEFTCLNRDTMIVHDVDRVWIDSAITCHTMPSGANVFQTNVKVKREYDPGVRFSWNKLNPSSVDVITRRDSNLQFVSSSFQMIGVGERAFLWRNQSLSNTNCYMQDTLKITLVSKADAGVDACLVGNAVKLKANPYDVTKNEKGNWKVLNKVAVFSDSLNPSATATLIEKGNARFVWTIVNGSCSNTDTMSLVSINQAATGHDSCLYFNDHTNVFLRTNPLGNNEVGSWAAQANGAIIDSLNPTTWVASKLTKGQNVFLWKVKSRFEPSCTSQVFVSYFTLSESGFDRNDVTVCSKDTIISTGQTEPLEEVNWNIYPEIRSFSATNNRVELGGLSNDTTYKLVRSITLMPSCPTPLKDSIFIRNEQVDSIHVIPKDITSSTQGAIYTCNQSIGLDVKNPKNDLISAQFDWTLEKPENSNAQIFQRSDTFYTVNNMISSGLYKIIYRVWNKGCPKRKVEIEIEKKTNLGSITAPDPVYICSDTFSFANLKNFRSFADPDSVTWSVERQSQLAKFKDPSMVHAKSYKDVKVVDLEARINNFVYKASKNGCVGSVSFFVFRNRMPPMAKIITNDSIETCNQTTHQLVAEEPTLEDADPNFFRFFWSNNHLLDTSHINKLEPTGTSVLVSNLPYDQSVFKYFVVQNGVCPPSIDSVKITNYQPVEAQILNDDDTLCTSEISVRGQKHTVGKGVWSISSASASISNDTSIITSISRLKPSDVGYTIWWTVRNGVCSNVDSIRVIVGDSVSEAKIIQDLDTLFICDSSSLHLKAQIPLLGSGVWYSVDSGWSYMSPSSFVKVHKGLNTYVWRVSKGVCASYDTSSIIMYPAPSIASAGDDLYVHAELTNLNAKIPLVGTGRWRLITGEANIEEPTNPNSQIKISSSESKFQWTVVNGNCPPSSDIVVVHFSDFNIPEGFSPNGDNKNDRFEIRGLENYPGTKLKVYNRWGRLVYSSIDYKNEWDANGLEDDTYFYVIEFSNGNKPSNGYLVVKRK